MIYNYLKSLVSEFFTKLKKKRVKFVYDSDLEMFLKKLDVHENVKSGKVKCIVCTKIITFENIGAIIKVKGHLEFICQNPICISNFNK